MPNLLVRPASYAYFPYTLFGKLSTKPYTELQVASYSHHLLWLPYHSYLPYTSLINLKTIFQTNKTNPSSTPAHSLPPSPPLLHSFPPATLLEMDNLLSQSSDSYCDLDPVPTTVIKKISNAISTTIISIVIFP